MIRSLLLKLIRLATAAAAVTALLWVSGWLLLPSSTRVPAVVSPEATAAALASRDVSFDPNHTPTNYVDQRVAPSGQSPILQELESTGRLSPLKDRLPDDPPVLAGPDSSGFDNAGNGASKYGGTWLRLASAPDDVSIITYRLSGPFLVRWSPLGYPIVPHIAKSVVPSDDMRTWTVTLRRGMRWSDGAPYTADDILYWWNDEVNNKTINALPPQWMYTAGKLGRVEKIDDEHVRFVFPEPYTLFLEGLAANTVLCDTPAHYLRRYHPDPAIGDHDLIARQMAAYKLPSARALYNFVKNWQNPECPRLWPWVYRTYKGDPPQVFVRNPYYFAIDPAGNQLPYIDRVQFDVQDKRLIPLSAANGGVSMQFRHLGFGDYTELVSRSAAAGTRILSWYPATRSTWVINPNLNRRVDPDDPTTRFKADLISEKHFRQALSLAIDRQRIITAEQAGIGKPSQVEPGPESAYHSEKLANAFIDHDPARANAMLDALGLTRRDREGYRTFRDGSRMTFYLDTTDYTGVGPAQFVVADWADVGIRAIPRERARSLFYTEKDAMDFDFNVWSSESDAMPLVQPRYFIPVNTESFYAVGWARWYQRGGFYNNPNAAARGCVPVPKDSPMYAAIALYEKALITADIDERKKLVSGIMDIAAENTWTISVATSTPVPVVVNKDLRNVPANAMVGVSYSTPANTAVETYYFEHPHDSPGAIAAAKESILSPTLRPGIEAGDVKSVGAAKPTWAARIGGIVKTLVVIAIVAALCVVAFRYPLIGRRLIIMVPTLAIISAIVFALIELPPGDFLSSRVMLLQENGDPSADQQIADLRELFHFGEPAWKLYARWLGLTYFTTFNPADEGLLQGNLGRSMETQQPIGTMVGDRIWLTVAVSLATILFTWAVALPIGIYSAVRQYSVGDYVLTLVGFIGMCVPAFLLALVLIAVSGLSGLFSPEFAAQPEWNGAKLIDLLRHIWIPIIVLGIGGTAGMIRVMRANLLDELKKPYVITAMAKGVRPMRLLLKYPVRLALNPFISGIGGLFPQLISGGAIVSMVLALPMVGPLLLQALLTEDTYLAGSMLMVLSLLGVVGTLVSDLLLLWLDPRIRFEGGGR